MIKNDGEIELKENIKLEITDLYIIYIKRKKKERERERYRL